MNNYFNIKEATQLYIDNCQLKTSMPLLKLILRAAFAGMMIASGASGSLVASLGVQTAGASKLLSGVVFPVGLMMVVMTGAELFTGDCLMIMGTADKRHKITELLRTLFFVYIGNFIGAVFIAFAVFEAGQLDLSGGALGAYTLKVALSKVSFSFGQAFISGVLCNILVCFAVIMALCAKDVTGKLLACFFVILLFVVSGFEHCVANMYYVTAGLFCKLNDGYVAAATELYGITDFSALSLKGLFFDNLIPVTLGNIVGGMCFVGLPLYILKKDN